MSEKQTPEEIKKNKRTMCIVFGLIFIFLCGVVPFATLNSASDSVAKNEALWTCSEFGAPFEVEHLKDRKMVVYHGVDHPLPDRIKGHAEGGAVGIEARCSDVGGTYYRVRGLDLNHELWWGWVKSTSIDS